MPPASEGEAPTQRDACRLGSHNHACLRRVGSANGLSNPNSIGPRTERLGTDLTAAACRLENWRRRGEWSTQPQGAEEAPRRSSRNHANPRPVAHATDRARTDALALRRTRRTADGEKAHIAMKALFGSSKRLLGMRLCNQPRPIRCASSRWMNCRFRLCCSRMDSIRSANATTVPVSRASVRRSTSNSTARS